MTTILTSNEINAPRLADLQNQILAILAGTASGVLASSVSATEIVGANNGLVGTFFTITGDGFEFGPDTVLTGGTINQIAFRTVNGAGETTTDIVIQDLILDATLLNDPAFPDIVLATNPAIIDPADDPSDVPVFGTDGPDTLFGTPFQDVIVGLGGDDTIIAFESNDVLVGGLGNDSLDGGAGNDQIFGEGGNDQLFGGSGNDAIFGGTGDDLLVGDAEGTTGNDGLFGGEGSDTVFGGFGADYIEGNAGRDFLFGETGNDSVLGGAGDDVLLGGSDNDFLSGGTGNDTLDGQTEDDALFGGAGNDLIFGGDGAGADVLFGEAGNDVLIAGDGSDYMVAGSGIDVVNGGTGGDFLKLETGQSGITFWQDFENGIDRIDASFEANAKGNVQISATADGTSTLIAYLDEQIVLEGVDFTTIDDADFLFAEDAVA